MLDVQKIRSRKLEEKMKYWSRTQTLELGRKAR